MPFQIIRGELTNVKADAFVNMTSVASHIGSGAEQVIFAAAGAELREARERIGAIAPGRSVETPAFRLKARYVLHTATPSWIDGRHGEEMLLRAAYDSALALAERLGCRSVAFPLAELDRGGFPHDMELSVAIGAFTDFVMRHDRTVYLVLLTETAYNWAPPLFAGLKRYIYENLESDLGQGAYGAARMMPQRLESERSLPLGSKQGKPSFRQKKLLSEDRFADHYKEESVGTPARFDGLDELLRQRESSFSEFLLDLLRERSGKDSEVYKRAEISRQLFSKILSHKDYQPTKSTAIQLAIGLQLDINQTQKLLQKAGYALTRSSQVDLVVQYYIERKVYSVAFINEALYDCGLPLLKTGLKS